MSDASTEAPGTPKLDSRPTQTPSLSTATRLSRIMRTLQEDFARNESAEGPSSVPPSDRMARLQESIGRMRDQSIRLREATEALKERSSALRQQSIDGIRALSPMSSTSSTTAMLPERRPSPSPSPELPQAEEQQDSSDDEAQPMRRDTGYWRDRLFAQLRSGQERAEAQSPPEAVPTPLFDLSPEVSVQDLNNDTPQESLVVEPERTFEEASQRTVHLGLELLRRTNSYSTLFSAHDEESDGREDASSDSEDSEVHWRNGQRDIEVPESSGVQETRAVPRAQMLSRLVARRPLPPPPPPPHLHMWSSRSSSVGSRTASPFYRGDQMPVPEVMPPFLWNIPRQPMTASTAPSSRASSPRPMLMNFGPQPVDMRTLSPAPSTLASASPRAQYTPFGDSLYTTAAEHACGWASECEKLKRQIDDVQSALAELRGDFEHAVSRQRLGSDMTQAPAAQTAVQGAVENQRVLPSTHHCSRFPPGFVPVPSPFMSSSSARPAVEPLPVATQFSALDAEALKIPHGRLPELKQELGLASKGYPSWTEEEKVNKCAMRQS